MGVIKRAWLYISRKRMKSIIMLFILFSVATAVLSGISIKKATVLSRKEGMKGLSNNFEVTNFGGQTNTIPKEIMKKISEIEGVEGYNASLAGYGEIKNVKKVQPTKIIAEHNDDYFKDVLMLNGNEDTEIDSKFANKMIKLVEGRHIKSSDKNKVLLHKSFAELNNYKVGDKITLSSFNNYAMGGAMLDNNTNDKTGEKESIEVEVVGIFDNVDPNRERVGFTDELVENLLIMDNNSISELNGYNDKEGEYIRAVFYVKEGVKVDDIISKIKGLPMYSEGLQILKGTDLFQALSSSYDTMEKLINMVLIGIIVISGGILSLILTFWIQGRIHETGILLSIGVPKFKILSQYVIELLIISVLGFSLAFFSGQVIAQGIGDSLVEKASKETVQDIKGQFGGMSLGNDVDSQMITHTVNDIDVKITYNEMIYVWVVGVAIIIVSVGLSSLSIIRLKPKEILSKMS